MKKFLILFLFISSLLSAQTRTFSAIGGNNTWTGQNVFNGPTTFTGLTILPNPFNFPGDVTIQNSTVTGTCTGCAGGGGSGTVTSFSSGNLSPLFTTVVATPTTTPTLSFSLSNFAAHTFYGNNTSGSATPGAQSIGLADLPGSGSVTINTSGPLGGGGSLALGGILSLTCTGCVTSIPQQPITKTAVASNWINSYDSATGLFTATRPAYTDLTG